MRAIVLSIGDELVLGQTVDTNSAWLSASLVGLGISTLYHQTIADDRAVIQEAIRLAAQQAKLVLISGGLGPTEDDLTRQALADALAQELVIDPSSLQAIEAFFSRRGPSMPQRNRSQALHPRSTTMIPNTCGTAPGIRAALDHAAIYVLPGVPHEMRQMFERSVQPELSAAADQYGVILSTKLHTFGMGESAVAEKLGRLMDRSLNPKLGTTVSDAIVSIRIRSEFPTIGEARSRLDQTAADVLGRLGPLVFGRDQQTLQESVLSLLAKTGQTLATAESCTGGLISKMLTDVPGSSEHYAGGWVAYSNDMKLTQLGVPADELGRHGGVSEAVARALARGSIERTGTDLSIAVTGLAGPGGGTDAKPVGTVWIALGERQKPSEGTVETGPIATEACAAHLTGDRSMIRDRAAKCALQMLRLHLLGEPLEHLQWARRSRTTS